jgi:AcrR family transcriptional regulator
MKPTTALIPPSSKRARFEARHARILQVAQVLFAEFGAANLGFNRLAEALTLYPATLRLHFEDLAAIEAAVAAMPPPQPAAPTLTEAQKRANIQKCGTRAESWD